MMKHTVWLVATGLIGAILIVPATASATARKGAAPRVSVLPAAGPAGYIQKTTSFTATNGADTAAVQTCPAGKFVLGGGVYSSSGSIDVSVNSDVPTKNNEGWHVAVNNTSGADSSETVYAICAKKPTAYKVVRVKQDNPADSQTSVAANCPAGAKILGGGGASLQAGPLYFALNDSFPSGGTSNAWFIHMDNASPSTDNTATAVAVCGKGVKGYKKVVSAPVTNPAGDQTQAFVDCPGSKVPIGGGMQSSSSSPLVTVNSSNPTSTGWEGYENNGSLADETIWAWSICAT